MPKVTYPLGSEEAHGAVGQSLIFQGGTVKAWRAPVIKKTPAQLGAQDKFQSVNKMMKVISLWGRGSLQAMLGQRWYSQIYKEIVDHWDEAEIAWDDLSSEHQAEWLESAPYPGTVLDCGKTFYICAYGIDAVCHRLGWNFFGVWLPEGTNAAAVRLFWDKSLDDVFGPGMFDDTNEDLVGFTTPGNWTDIEDAQAYGGSYHESHLTNAVGILFSFYGTHCGFLYRQTPGNGSAYVYIDNLAPVTFSQNGVEDLYQQEWNTEIFQKGLHNVYLVRWGAAGKINIDGIVVYG